MNKDLYKSQSSFRHSSVMLAHRLIKVFTLLNNNLGDTGC